MPFISSPGGTALGSVGTVTGTAAAGQVVDATSSTAAAWAYPPGYALSYVEAATSGTISATTSGTANTLITAGAITFDGSTVIQVEYYGPFHSCAAAATLVIGAFLDGTLVSILGQWQPAAAFATPAFLRSNRLTPSAGSHTYSIRAWRATANWSWDFTAGSSMTPGYVRVSIA